MGTFSINWFGANKLGYTCFVLGIGGIGYMGAKKKKKKNEKNKYELPTGSKTNCQNILDKKTKKKSN